jgi:hypothetical protein
MNHTEHAENTPTPEEMLALKIQEAMSARDAAQRRINEKESVSRGSFNYPNGRLEGIISRDSERTRDMVVKSDIEIAQEIEKLEELIGTFNSMATD